MLKPMKTHDNVPDYQRRVISERSDLCVKLISLECFMTTGIFQSINLDEQTRMIKQSKIMKDYVDILTERIENFDKKGTINNAQTNSSS